MHIDNFIPLAVSLFVLGFITAAVLLEKRERSRRRQWDTEVEKNLQDYTDEVDASNMSDSMKQIYRDHARKFVQWLNGRHRARG